MGWIPQGPQGQSKELAGIFIFQIAWRYFLFPKTQVNNSSCILRASMSD